MLYITVALPHHWNTASIRTSEVLLIAGSLLSAIPLIRPVPAVILPVTDPVPGHTPTIGTLHLGGTADCAIIITNIGL